MSNTILEQVRLCRLIDSPVHIMICKVKSDSCMLRIVGKIPDINVKYYMIRLLYIVSKLIVR